MWSKYERSVFMFIAKPWVVILLLTLIPIEAILASSTHTPVGLLLEVAWIPKSDSVDIVIFSNPLMNSIGPCFTSVKSTIG